MAQIQGQGQKQNVKVVINLADTKKKRKPRRKRIRQPPKGKSSFQQVLRDNQAPQVIVRRIYDQSPYLDELNKSRTAQQGIMTPPVSAPVIQTIPLTSQANRKNRLGGGSRSGGENTEAVVVRAGERQDIPTNPNTSILTGTPEPPPVELPSVRRRKERSDKGKKRDKTAPLRPAFENALQRGGGYDSESGGDESDAGGRSFLFRRGRESLVARGGSMSEDEREQARSGRLRRMASLNQYASGTNTGGQV